MVVVVVVLLFVGRRGGGVGDDNGVVRLERIYGVVCSECSAEV